MRKNHPDFKIKSLILQRQLKAAVGVMVLLGTGWFFGIFMSVPLPALQVGFQYMFILLNSSQVFD